MKKLEFYSFEDQVWYMDQNGEPHKLEESSREVICFMIQNFQDFYPEAYADLVNKYKGCNN